MMDIQLMKRAREAPFLADAIERLPHIVTIFEAQGADAAIAAAHCEGADKPLRQRLRHQRRALALAIALGDLSGAFTLEQVCAYLSDFADVAVDAAIADAIRHRHPDGPLTGFVAIALGKHGSRELNYSSDIDPILLYDPATLPHRDREDSGEAAVRVARHIVDLLQSRDADGYVFRVDLRLRPASEATPLALSVDAAIGHYESSALAWERFAFVRGRAAAGDVAVGCRFLDAIAPFVWRRSLDFGAIKDLRSISSQIRDHYEKGQILGPGYDLKRGRGGIREVEFYVQVQQLIHGGRDPSLRQSAILDAIVALRNAGHFDEATATVLGDAYRALRTIEHRLQMMEDRQTHSLPEDPLVLDSVARLHGLSSGDDLLAWLAPHVRAVSDLFDAIDSTETPSIPRAPDQVEQALLAAGFHDTQNSATRIAGLRSGRVRALRSDAALAALESILPALIAAFGRAPDPDAVLAAFDAMIERLPSAMNLLRLLEARPALLMMLTDVIAHAPTLAEALSHRPALLDRLLETSAVEPVGSVNALIETMRDRSGNLEQCLDNVRHHVAEHRFALGAQIVRGLSDPLVVAAGYARVAEAAIVVVADAVIADFAAVHGQVPGSELVILALGRLGGSALTHASDLDLIYLFTGDFRSESDGLKPLGATHYYNRLGQRLTRGLSAPTSAGPLYDVDMRLRPSGSKGPLVVSLESFAHYQAEVAWTWEHMALMRARPIYGSDAARFDVAAVIDRTLRQPRDATKVKQDAVKMRADMAQHKPPTGRLDVKLIDGGLVDLEFIVHVLQMTTGHGLSPDLNVAVAALFDAPVQTAHAVMTRLLVTLRLMAPRLDDVPIATQPLIASACGARDWHELLAWVERARQEVRLARKNLFGMEI